MSSQELGAARRQKAAMILQTWGVYLGLLALLAVSAAVSPRSFNAQDLLNLAKQASSLGIVSIGQTGELEMIRHSGPSAVLPVLTAEGADNPQLLLTPHSR